MLKQFNKTSFFFLVAGLLAPTSFAGAEQDAQVLLSKSFQQANLWNQGPVKLVAKVLVDNATGDLRNLQYTISWAGPGKWRAEWSAPNLRQITIVNNGKLSYVSTRSKLVWSTIWFEAALAALDAGIPTGPYLLPPLAYQNAKFHASKKRVDGTEVPCFVFGKPETTLCIDPANGHLLTVDSDLGSFEYSDYTSVGGSNSYPRTVKLNSVNTSYEGDDYFYSHGVAYPQSLQLNRVESPLEEAQVTVTRGEQFPDSLFVPSQNSATVDFATCADPASNFTAPRLDKSVKAKRPEAARKASGYGTVWVLAAVDKDGSVRKTRILWGQNDLRAGATSAVQQYRYTPYVRCGQAVEFQQVVKVPFPPPAPPVYNYQPPQPTYP